MLHFINLKNQRFNRIYGVQVRVLPPYSPDLNPIEKYWSWLRRHLQKMDLEDLTKRKKVPSKTEYKARVRSVMQTNKSQEVAENIMQNFRKHCEKVKNAGGAAVKG